MATILSLSPQSGATLVFSFIGYASKEVEIGNQSQINVQLTPDRSDLDKEIVTGYDTMRKSQLTGAISSVSSQEIAELPIVDARQALQGRATGVDVTSAGSKPGATHQVRIRGKKVFLCRK